MKYRKRPIIIDAERWTGQNRHIIGAFIPFEKRYFLSDSVRIITLEGTMIADVGDWIIKGIRDEFYPCKPDIFEATYEPVEERP